MIKNRIIIQRRKNYCDFLAIRYKNVHPKLTAQLVRPIITPPTIGGTTAFRNLLKDNIFLSRWKNCLQIPGGDIFSYSTVCIEAWVTNKFCIPIVIRSIRLSPKLTTPMRSPVVIIHGLYPPCAVQSRPMNAVLDEI